MMATQDWLPDHSGMTFGILSSWVPDLFFFSFILRARFEFRFNGVYS